MGEAGREMVGKYAQDVTDYYCMASELDNHCVRESACHSIAEMAEKVRIDCWHGRSAVLPVVTVALFQQPMEFTPFHQAKLLFSC